MRVNVRLRLCYQPEKSDPAAATSMANTRRLLTSSLDVVPVSLDCPDFMRLLQQLVPTPARLRHRFPSRRLIIIRIIRIVPQSRDIVEEHLHEANGAATADAFPCGKSQFVGAISHEVPLSLKALSCENRLHQFYTRVKASLDKPSRCTSQKSSVPSIHASAPGLYFRLISSSKSVSALNSPST